MEHSAVVAVVGTGILENFYSAVVVVGTGKSYVLSLFFPRIFILLLWGYRKELCPLFFPENFYSAVVVVGTGKS